MDTLEELVIRFREALDEAKSNNEFCRIIPFCNFPKGCCDMTCDILGHYLLCYGIETYQLNGQHWDDKEGYSRNHVWLVTTEGVVIDITGDQFRYEPHYKYYSKRVHIGSEDTIHQIFDERRCKELNMHLEGKDTKRRKILNQVYKILEKYL